VKLRAVIACAAAIAWLAAGAASAQDYPTKPVRLIVPFPPGGPSDFFARIFGQKASELLGQPIVIENKSGAGGVLGIDQVAKAAPDGYTLGLSNAGAVAIAPGFQPMPYDVDRDLALLTLVASVPEVLVVAGSVPASSVEELVRLARAKPGQINFASAGNGGMPHLAGELFKAANRIDIVHVPYRGAAPAVTDLLSGQVQMLIADTPILLPHIRSGALRALGMASRQRSAMLPDLPTVAEAGGGSVEADNWYGLVAPRRTPQPVLDRIVAASRTALASPEVADKFAEQGARAGGMPPAEFAAYVKSEAAKWRRLVETAGLKPD
jgi:tripartite-type tricarboxylate transporter receptor subunit TctC